MEEESSSQLRRSSRSRSNTPFIRESRGRDSIHEAVESKRGQVKGRQKATARQKSTFTTVSESHTSEVSSTNKKHTTDIRRSDSDRDSDSSAENMIEEELKSGRHSDRQRVKRRLLINGATPRKGDEMLARVASAGETDMVQKQQFHRHKTSDYSSEEGEGIAYQVYKRAGDWWNKFPKTDYTYSKISPHRKEVAPGVICMPNMSRRSLNTVHHNGSSENTATTTSTITTVSKHDLTKSRWFDRSTSGSQASRKVMETWAAVDSDVDEVDSVTSSKSTVYTHKSWTVTTVITSFFMTIWTLIIKSYIHIVDAAYRLVGYPRNNDIYVTPRRGISPLRGEGSPSWLRRVFNWFYGMGCSVMQLDLLVLSSLHRSQEKQEHEILYDEDYYEETDAISKLVIPRKRNMWRLLLLLLPLLFLAGWWGISEVSEVSLNALQETAGSVWHDIVGWMFIPFNAYSALKEKLFTSREPLKLPPIILPASRENAQQNQAVDMDSLVSHILASTHFQHLLAAHVRTEMQETKKEHEEFRSTLVEQDQLHQLNVKLLKEHQTLISQLTSNLQEMQKKVNDLNAEAKSIEAHRQDWELKWEKEKEALRMETVANARVPDNDNLLLHKELREVQARLRLLQEQQSQMMRRCCQRGSGYSTIKDDVIEHQVLKVLANLLGASGEQFSGNSADLRAWVSSMLLAQDRLEAKLANLTATLHLHTREAVLRSKEVILAAVTEHIQNEFVKWQEQQRKQEVRATVTSNMGTWSTNSSGVPGLTDGQVQAIVDQALAKYDADKTGLVDYALESSGGSIMSTRCTEAYQAKTAKLTLLGIPLWYPSNNPRTVIQPGVHPGECWAFSGSQGFLVIQLSGLVKVTGFSLEHIPRSLSPHGRIDSAPKDFSVWGLKELQDTEPVLLGKYTYRQNSTSLQYFNVQHVGVEPFVLVELRIESNHGNIEYTCLYRFRVHGHLFSD